MDVSDDYQYVSTGQLPPAPDVSRLIESAHARYRDNREGACSQVYPALAEVPPDLFGVCIVDTSGQVHAAGAVDHDFTIMSISKPFVFALVCEEIGPTRARESLGVNATGLPFNSILPFELSPDGRSNPMVNAGAIAATSLIPGATCAEKWQAILSGMSAFAGRSLALNEAVLASARETNLRNRGIAHLLHSLGLIYSDPMEALDLYTMQCSLDVNSRDIATMGATLANGGVNPVTRQRVIAPLTCHYTLAVMATAGLYENSGDWLYEIGLPGKSGIGGGIVTVSPGKGGLGTFAPRLDQAGNSVKGRLVAEYLSQHLGIDLFVSQAKS